MRKLIAFIIRLGCFCAGLYFFSQYLEHLTGHVSVVDHVPHLLKYAILTGVSFLLAGCGKRIYYIDQDAIEEEGLFPSILTRIFCKRLLIGIIIYFGMTALSYALYMFMRDRFEFIWGIVGLICFAGGIMALKYSCKRCGHGIVLEDTDYDNDITITDSSIYRHSTDLYCCPRCGKRTTIRSKHTIAHLK